MKKFFFLWSIVLISFQFSFSSTIKEDDFAKIDKDLNKGEYKLALRKAKNLLGKYSENSDNLTVARINFKLAKVYDALGRFEEYKKSADAGAANFAKAEKKDTIFYLYTCIEGIAAYSEYGEYVKALPLLESAKQLLDDKDHLRGVKADLFEKEILLLFKMGYYKKAEEYSADLIKIRKNILDKPFGGKKKWSTKELKEKKSDLARAVNLLSEIKITNSDLYHADSLLDANLKWIPSGPGKKRIEFSRALFYKGSVYEIKGEASKAGAHYAKALKRSYKSKDVRYKLHSKEALAYHEKLIPALKKAGRSRKSSKREKQLEARIKRYYGKDSYAYGTTQLILADRYYREKDYSRAQTRFQNLLKDTKYFPENHVKRIDILCRLYRSQIENEDFLNAEATLKEISQVTLKTSGIDAPVYHFGLLEEAKYIVSYGAQFSRAEEIFSSSLQNILEKEVPHSNLQYIEGLYSKAKLCQYRDRYEDALNTLQQVKASIEMNYGSTSDHYAIALEKYASLQLALGQYNEAEETINKALNYYSTQKNNDRSSGYAQCLETLSRFYIIQGKFRDAERAVKKAIKITKNLNGNEKVSTISDEFINLNILTGKYAATEKALLEILKIRESKFGGSHRSLIVPLNQLASLYLITGDYTNAEKLVRKAYKISEDIFGSKSSVHAENIKLLVKIYTAIGDYDKAEEAGNKALAIQQVCYGKNHLQVALTLNELATVKFYGNPHDAEAEKLFNRAMSIIKTFLGDNNLNYAEVLKNLAMYYIENGKSKQAGEFLDNANKIWITKLGQVNIHSAEAAFTRGTFYSKEGKYLEAKASFTTSKSLYERIFDSEHPDYVKALSKEGQMLYILNDYKAAIRCLDETTIADLKFIRKYFPSLSDRQKNRYWNLIKDDFEFYNTLAIKFSKDTPELLENVYNFNLQTKAILLNSSIKVKERILSSNDQELIKSFESWIEKKEFLTSALSMNAEQLKENGIDVKLLEKEIEILEKELSEKSESFQVNYEKSDVDWKQVRNLLKPGEYALEIVRFRYFDKGFSDSVIYAGLLLTKESKGPELVLIPNGNELEKRYLNYYRNCIKLNVEDLFSYEKFWKPFSNLIVQNSTVYLSGDGVYNQINLETICAPDKTYLLDRYDIVLISNTRDLIKAKKNKSVKKQKGLAESSNKIKLFGNPTYYDDFDTGKTSGAQSFKTAFGLAEGKKIPQLPGAEGEIRHLNALMAKNGWETEAYLNNDATESNLKAVKDPKVFHIATHGFFMEDMDSDYHDNYLDKNLQNPLLRAGLLLKNGGALLEKANLYELNSEDGVLTAYEAMNLYLDHTDLVVLSACETGVGKVQLGEGVWGLQRAFLIAGANSVIMSLFKVSDEVTKELMTVFYDKWLTTGLKRKSLLEAKRYIKEKYNDPIYWGAFVMIGVDEK